ncbi:MAG: biopolymer transporter ExbD [Oculatellaceae cyanobacterium Prado106]|jgi:biopolymer transport protein ExbD|nr:biopolymer transporter ExbD [Oculatellaceae cyanobacterium Prado106]
MPLKSRNARNTIPEVNLVPMMNILMTVLTFFILVTMTLTGRQMFNINLPVLSPKTAQDAEDGNAETRQLPTTRLTLGINPNGQIMLEEQVLTTEQTVQQVVTFLTENPTGVVMLKADRQLNYDQVTGVLKTLRDIGGDRVYLGIERRGESTP